MGSTARLGSKEGYRAFRCNTGMRNNRNVICHAILSAKNLPELRLMIEVKIGIFSKLV